MTTFIDWPDHFSPPSAGAVSTSYGVTHIHNGAEWVLAGRDWTIEVDGTGRHTAFDSDGNVIAEWQGEPMADRGRDTSYELTQVRTVLSRAETALRLIEDQPNTWAVREGHERLDPDREHMMTALSGVVSLLGKWARTGRSKA